MKEYVRGINFVALDQKTSGFVSELKLPVDRVTSQLSVDHDSQIVFQFFSGVVELIAREKISFTQNINPESSDDAATSLTVDNAFSYESNQISNSVLPVEDNGKGIATWVRDVVRKYIKLAAALDVEALEKFVRKSAALVSIEDAIEICQALVIFVSKRLKKWRLLLC